MTEFRSRTTAEWVTFGISLAIVLALFVAIGFQAVGRPAPARPEVANTGPVEQRGALFHVPVTIENRGDSTAADVQVAATISGRGDAVEGQQVIDFLAGGERHELVFVFEDDPRRGGLSVRVTGFTVP